MKKVLALAVAFGLGFALMGCNAPEASEEGAPVVEEVVPAAEVVEVVLPTEEVIVDMDMDAMNGEMVMDEVIAPEDVVEVVEEIVETPAE